MNKNISAALKNIGYSFSANLISTFISIVLVLVVPKALGVEQYSYWQLYVFYTSYVGFFHFGWADGIYLRYGGQTYQELNKPLLHSQFWLLTLFEVILTVIFVALTVIFIHDPDRKTVLIFTSLCCILLLPRTMLQYLLQGSGRIKEYSRNVIIEKLIYGVLVVGMVLYGIKEYRYMLYADMVAKIYTLTGISWCCRDILISKGISFVESAKEMWLNVSVGIKLMFSNIANMLIIGIVRFSIEKEWDIATFGKISLSLSVSNLMMVFISAVSMVLFPIIKRMPEEKWSRNYSGLRIGLVAPVMGAMLFYYPASMLLSAWLPQYSEGLRYMAILFPICLYEGKMSMLINTYLKALRKEKTILLVNVTSLLLSGIVTFICAYLLHSLQITVLSILLLLIFRCTFAELMLSGYIHVNVVHDIVYELLLTAIFIIASWFISGWASVGIYLAAYGCYVAVKRNDIRNALILVFAR